MILPLHDALKDRVRAILADALSWHEAGLVQALWRASDWITSLASGALGLYFLPLLALADVPKVDAGYPGVEEASAER